MSGTITSAKSAIGLLVENGGREREGQMNETPLNWERGMFTLKIHEHGVVVDKDVFGVVCGPFGIVRQAGRFSLTHIQSGLNLHWYDSLEAAKGGAVRLSTVGVDWTVDPRLTATLEQREAIKRMM